MQGPVSLRAKQVSRMWDIVIKAQIPPPSIFNELIKIRG